MSLETGRLGRERRAYERSRRSGAEYLLILDEVERWSNISQRSLADRLGMAVSLINRHLRCLLEDGHIEILDRNVRPFAYDLTGVGREYRTRLSQQHYQSVLGSFGEMKARIERRLRELTSNGVRSVVFYGSGEVMAVTYPIAVALGLKVIGLVDDDADKQGSTRGLLEIRPPAAINELRPDAVVITTFRHADKILARIDPALRPSVQVFAP